MAISSATSGKDSLMWTLPTFVDHFKQNDVLEIPPNTEFILTRADFAYDRNLCEVQDRDVEKLSDLINKYFNPLLTLIGKKMEVESKGPSEGGMNIITGDVYLTSASKMTLRAKKASTLQTRMTDFFCFMAYCSISTVKLDSDQTLEVKLTEDEKKNLRLDKKSDGLWALIQRRMLSVYSCSLRSPGGYITLSLLEEERVSIECKTGLELQLIDKLQFQSVEDFRQRLRLSNEITIPANQSLSIRDGYFKRYLDRTSSIELLSMVLNDLVAPLAQAVCVKAPSFHLRMDDYQFILKVVVDSKIFLSPEPRSSVIRDCRDFVHSILKSGQALVIPARFHLIFEEIHKDPSRDLIQFLSRHAPVGTVWMYKYEQLECFVRNGSTCFRSPMPIYLSLMLMPGDAFIKFLLKNSSPECIAGLCAGDKETIHCLFFKALFYLTQSDNVPDDFPSFFLPTTLQKMKELAKKYKKPSFEENDLLERILNLTPKEFHKLKKNSLPPRLENLISDISSLSFEERKGGPLNKVIAQVAHELRSLY